MAVPSGGKTAVAYVMGWAAGAAAFTEVEGGASNICSLFLIFQTLEF
jgi:hypothetical protein